jgi:PAS domain S-box-containing protein
MTDTKVTSEIKLQNTEVHDLVLQWAESDAALKALEDAQKKSGTIGDPLSPRLLDQVLNSLTQSRVLLEKMLASMQVGVAYLDPKFNYVWVNPAFARQRGCAPDDFSGSNHVDVTSDPKDGQRLKEMGENGKPLFFYAEALSIPEGSEIRYWDRSFQPVHASSGIVGWIYTEYDVTDHIRVGMMSDEHNQRIRSEPFTQEKQAEQDLLNKVFEIDPAGLAVLSGPDLMIRIANQKFRSMITGSQIDPTGLPLNEVLSKEDDLFTLLHTLLQKEAPIDLNHHERRFSDGSKRWYNCHIRLMHWNEEPAFMVNLWDATDDHIAYLNIESETAEAQRRAEELNAVISAMSEAVTIFDKKGQPVMVNPATVQAYGFDPVKTPRTEAIQKLAVRRMNGEAVEIDELPSARALKGEWVRHEQYVFTNSENRQQIIIASASPLYNNGELFGAVTVWTDVTEREELLRHIKIERSRLSTIIVNAPVGIVAIDGEGKLLVANSMSADLWGEIVEENGQLPSHQNTLPDGTPFNPVDLARYAINGQTQVNHEIVLKKPNGDRQYLLVNSAPIVNKKGDIEGAVAIFQDITAQKKAEENLKDAKERFVIALKNSPIMVYKTDRELRYTWVYNSPFDSSKNMIGLRDDELDGADDVAEMMAFKRSVLMNGKGERQEIQMVIDGLSLIYDVTAEPLYDEQGEITGVTVAAVDITDQKRIKDEMSKNIARIEVQRHLIQQRELERLQIARDLHDGPLQELIGINYGLREALDIPHRRQRRLKVNEIQNGLQELIQEMRGFCSELRPPALAPFGLEKAIRSHIESFEEKHSEIGIELDLAIDQDRLTEEVRMALYRIYQELMNNIVKHARASFVSVRFRFDDRIAELEVSDNGKGFLIPDDWVEIAREGHLGLVGIFERTEAVGGTIKITSKSGAGTAVLVTVPIQSGSNLKDSVQSSSTIEEK